MQSWDVKILNDSKIELNTSLEKLKKEFKKMKRMIIVMMTMILMIIKKLNFMSIIFVLLKIDFANMKKLNDLI